MKCEVKPYPTSYQPSYYSDLGVQGVSKNVTHLTCQVGHVTCQN